MSGAQTPVRGALSDRRRIIVAVLGVTAVVIAAAAARLLIRAAPPQPPPAAPPAAAAGTFRPTNDQWRNLTFAEVRSAAFPAQEATDGMIATDDDVTVQILPPFSGQVTQVLVKAGDSVVKGQALALANASEFAQAQSDLAASAANLAAARVALNVARLNADRQQALFKINGNAARDVQQSQSDLPAPGARAPAPAPAPDPAPAAVRNRLRILGYSDAQIDTLQAQPSVAATAAASIRSPVAGVVTQRQVGPGQYVNATSNGATTPLFTVSDLSQVWLTANVREEDADKMRVGDPIEVTVAAIPGQVFNARLNYVAPVIDPTTRRLLVHATIANPQGLLKPQMLAGFVITSGHGETAPAVPAQAVIYEGDTARVWVARPDHTLALRYFKAGRTRAGMVEALDQLQPGDQVVVTGALFIDRAAQSS